MYLGFCVGEGGRRGVAETKDDPLPIKGKGRGVVAILGLVLWGGVGEGGGG